MRMSKHSSVKDIAPHLISAFPYSLCYVHLLIIFFVIYFHDLYLFVLL